MCSKVSGDSGDGGDTGDTGDDARDDARDDGDKLFRAATKFRSWCRALPGRLCGGRGSGGDNKLEDVQSRATARSLLSRQRKSRIENAG